MLKPLIFSCLFLVTFASAKELPTTQTWTHEESDLAVDSRAIFGTLENGFRYIIYKNTEPPQRVSLRLHVAAGSLSEADDQQGMAHFLEHMLFDGSKNYTSAELIPEMQRLGIAFGAHANAYTSFDETVYKLDLPNLEAKTLDLGFTVMRVFCDGALLETKGIEEERGVILSEKNSRDSVDFRMMKKQFEYLMPDFLAANRFPIGTEECIKNTPPERIRDFYKDFYDPKLMTFVFVGDIDPKVFEQRIKDTFSSLKSPETAGTAPPLGTITEPTALTTKVFTDPEVDEEDISITRAHQHQSTPQTYTTVTENIKMQLANSIISKRFSTISKQEKSPINSGAAYKFTWFNALTMGVLTVTPTEGKWKEAVPLIEQEFRRALQHGFTDAEFQEATAELLTSSEQAVQSFDTRTSASIADSIIPTLNDRKVITSAQTDLEIVEKLLATLTKEDCHAAFSTYWDVPGYYLTLTVAEEKESDAKTLQDLFQKSQATEVTAPVEKEIGAFAYSSFGEPSTITEQKHIADLDIHQLTLSNGIRVNLKKTDFEKDKIYLTARLGSGLLGLSNHKPGWTAFTNAVINLGGLGKHTNEEIRQIFSNQVAGIQFGIGEDAFTYSGLTNKDDLQAQLRLLCAYLTDPGFHPEAERLYKKALPDQYEQLAQTLEGAMQYMSAHERGDDPRFSVPTEEQASAFAIKDVSEVITNLMKASPIELTLVGDLDIEQATKLIQSTLGDTFNSWNRIGDIKAKPTPLTKLPETNTSHSFTYKSTLDRAATVVNWRTTGLTENISEGRRLSLLAQIISNRMKDEIREKLGSSYSPYAYSNQNDTFKNLGVTKAVAICKSADMKKIAEIILKIGEDIAAEGATQDELDRVQKPAISGIEGTLRKNSYWLSTVLAKSQAQPKRLDWARSRTEDYTSVKLEEINELAKKYLKPENAITYKLHPEKK